MYLRASSIRVIYSGLSNVANTIFRNSSCQGTLISVENSRYNWKLRGLPGNVKSSTAFDHNAGIENRGFTSIRRYSDGKKSDDCYPTQCHPVKDMKDPCPKKPPPSCVTCNNDPCRHYDSNDDDDNSCPDPDKSKHDARFKLFRAITLFVGFPLIVLMTIHSFRENEARSKQPRPPFVYYPYMHRRTKISCYIKQLDGLF
ncbi:uncharacterized protein [Prorops nasuta]|uniref:uncharacterized protein isoform X2 n=1 Tax=Prorops nasuta TaxID=863751 RepID=UPI0034CE45E5